MPKYSEGRTSGRLTRIGFPFSIGGGGPSLFMRRLRRSILSQSLAHTSNFLNPFNDINIFSNRTRNIYGKPYVFRVDGIYFDKAQPEHINKRKNKPIFDGIDSALGVVFQSQFSLSLIKNFHGNITGPYEIINNGVDTNFFSPVGSNKRAHLGIGNNDLVFVTSAKWRSHKRLEDVINVFIQYGNRTNTPCHLIILGHTDLQGVSHPHVYAIGHVPLHELPSWYRAGNIFLFFSWLDNCPNTVVEAIACGLPVVCTNQGGTREIVEITNGGIVVGADDEFAFDPVDLYNPPKPDYDKILAAVQEVACNHTHFVGLIDKTFIDIDSVAKEYVDFISEIIRD